MTHLASEIVHLTSGGHKSHEIEDIVGRQELYVASLSKINSVANATSSELTVTKHVDFQRADTAFLFLYSYTCLAQMLNSLLISQQIR